MISKLKLVTGKGTDPFRNIALEKVLTLRAEEGECVFFLWQNRRTVVIGRNQNAWEECRVGELLKDGGRLARRLSGGGAVYHDLGNLNFSFILRGADYDTARQSEVVLRAVRKLGVPAERTGRNDMEADGRKFSGNAFFQAGDCRCHHGTVMLDVDTAAMMKYLTVPPSKLHSRGVGSVRSRVVNLKELCPDIGVESLSARLREALEEVYGLKAEEYPPERLPEEEIRAEAEKLASEDWLFPARIPFTGEIVGRFPWGGIQIRLSVERNRVDAAECSSDAMDERLIREIGEALAGCPFDAEILAGRAAEAARKCGEASGWTDARLRTAEDVASLIREQLAGNGSGE